jgi:DsbC/DsbD-like thiol-disulfide interchange protein
MGRGRRSDRTGDALTVPPAMHKLARCAAVAIAYAVPAVSHAQRPDLVATLERVRGQPNDSALTLRLSVRMERGWHIGAIRPGAVGLPTELSWELPQGVRLVEERWPTPTVDFVPGRRDTAFIYGGTLIVDASFVRASSARNTPIKAVLSYGICSKDLCIPGRETLTFPR